jgi:hypothetical protein
MAITRGSDKQFRFFDATGAIVRLINPTSCNINLDANAERQKRLGTRQKPGRLTIDGHSGSATFEIEGPELQDLMDMTINAYRDGEPETKLELFEVEYYPKTGTRRTYRYPGVLLTFNTDNPEQDSPSTVTVNFTTELRVIVGQP